MQVVCALRTLQLPARWWRSQEDRLPIDRRCCQEVTQLGDVRSLTSKQDKVSLVDMVVILTFPHSATERQLDLKVQSFCLSFVHNKEKHRAR